MLGLGGSPYDPHEEILWPKETQTDSPSKFQCALDPPRLSCHLCRKCRTGTSLVVQWLRSCCPLHRSWIWFLVGELHATEQLSPRATATESGCSSYRIHTQQWKISYATTETWTVKQIHYFFKERKCSVKSIKLKGKKTQMVLPLKGLGEFPEWGPGSCTS